MMMRREESRIGRIVGELVKGEEEDCFSNGGWVEEVPELFLGRELFGD